MKFSQKSEGVGRLHISVLSWNGTDSEGRNASGVHTKWRLIAAYTGYHWAGCACRLVAGHRVDIWARQKLDTAASRRLWPAFGHHLHRHLTNVFMFYFLIIEIVLEILVSLKEYIFMLLIPPWKNKNLSSRLRLGFKISPQWRSLLIFTDKSRDYQWLYWIQLPVQSARDDDSPAKSTPK